MNPVKKYFVLALIFLAGCSSNKKEDVTSGSAIAVNDLPTMAITKTDGSGLNIKGVTGKTVLVLFQPDCDHCQREAVQIKNHLESFQDYTLYFISSDALDRIGSFAKEYELAGFDNIHFGQTDTQNILNNFGPIDAPSLYIYNAEGRLVKKFNGETEITLILNSL